MSIANVAIVLKYNNEHHETIKRGAFSGLRDGIWNEYEVKWSQT